MKKICSVASALGMALMVILTVLLFLPRLAGIKPMAVLSGSMEPTYPVGSLIYVKDAEPEEISVGSPLTFQLSDGTVVTHRVTQVLEQEQGFHTKGDANDAEDGGMVSFGAVLGVPIFMIPLLGYVTVYAKTKAGIILIVTAILVILIVSFLPDIIRKCEKLEVEHEKN